MNKFVQCVWYKRDLRVRDHGPLMLAAQSGPIVPVYVIEPKIVNSSDFDAMHWQFIRESLQDLQASLKNLGVPLQIMKGDEKFRFSKLWAHEETGNGITYKRDQAVAGWAGASNIQFIELPQNGVVRRLQDRDGWSHEWERRMHVRQFDTPEDISCPDGLMVCPVPSISELRLKQTLRETDVNGGESAGMEMLSSFIESRGHRYHCEISSPNTAYDSCSRLSAYLPWGCLSMRTVVQTVRAAATDGQLPKVVARSFLSRCHWHCHFMQKLESEPAIEFHAFNRACDDLRTEGSCNEKEKLSAWQSGCTGYPFVDACIRSLKAHGWINFRMRAMLVSFASYHLWLDWRLFKDWLARQFIDYEPGIHISQIQMQSGLTGINTLRIYNPIKQGQDHDPSGFFIRRWVPELSAVEGSCIHEPWKMPELKQAGAGCKMGRQYPYLLLIIRRQSGMHGHNSQNYANVMIIGILLRK